MIITDKQKEFINNATHRYNLKIGARRCGKTYLDILYVIPKRITERRGKDGINVILGVTKSTIERNILIPLRELYGDKLIGRISSSNTTTLFGELVYCLGAENKGQVSKIQGSSIKYCYCDELARYSQEVFEMLKGSLDKEYSVLDGALNPENRNHWLKTEFLDKIEEKELDVYTQYYTIFDNPFLPKKFVTDLCNEYRGTVYYNRLILGEWCDAEGIIFKAIANNKERYLTDEKQNGFLSIGIDWGGNGSAHSITATIIDRMYKSIQVVASDRYEATGTDTVQLFNWIINFIKQILLEYGTIDLIFCDSAEQVLINSLIKVLRQNGFHIPIKNSVKTSIKGRIEAINILLNVDRISFKKNRCNPLIDALQTAVYDEKSQDDKWLDDGTSDIDSLDSFNYSIEYWYPQLMKYGG